MGWMDDAMVELRPWIGRVRMVEDDLGMMAVRRVAATFNVDPDGIKQGDELPPHWFTVFFAETVRAERARARRPSQQGHRPAADPDAAPHGRRSPRARSWAGCAPASRR